MIGDDVPCKIVEKFDVIGRNTKDRGGDSRPANGGAGRAALPTDPTPAIVSISVAAHSYCCFALPATDASDWLGGWMVGSWQRWADDGQKQSSQIIAEHLKPNTSVYVSAPTLQLLPTKMDLIEWWWWWWWCDETERGKRGA